MGKSKLIQSLGDYEKLHMGEKYSYFCRDCNALCNKIKRCSEKENQRLFLCRKCLIKKKSLEKYGVESPNQLSSKKEKTKQTCIKKYGVENPNQSDAIKEKKKRYFLKAYGSNSYMGTDEFRNKSSESLKEKYGVDNYSKAIGFKDKVLTTSLEKYGTNHPSQSNSVKEKTKQTCLDHFGVPYGFFLKDQKYYPLSEESKQKRDKKIHKTFQDLVELEKAELTKTYGEVLTVAELSKRIDRHPTTIWAYHSSLLIKGNYSSYLPLSKLDEFEKLCTSNANSSMWESEVYEWLKSIYPKTIIQHDRKLLEGKELDIYLPDCNIALECDGIYWHSNWDGDEYKARYRHIQKTKACENKGIRLIHIFEDDWRDKKPIIQSIVKNALGICDRRVFARKCDLKTLDTETYKNFLNTYHLQGYSMADIRIGLFYKEELMECVGIRSKGNHSKEPELVRLCSKQGVNIVGGFSKLLKHSEFEVIASYVDIATFAGQGYKKVGFEIVKQNRPTYFWIRNGRRYPRYTLMKKNLKGLKDKGFLSFVDLEKTEDFNAKENGFLKLYNCGTYKVIWRK